MRKPTRSACFLCRAKSLRVGTQASIVSRGRLSAAMFSRFVLCRPSGVGRTNLPSMECRCWSCLPNCITCVECSFTWTLPSDNGPVYAGQGVSEMTRLRALSPGPCHPYKLDFAK